MVAMNMLPQPQAMGSPPQPQMPSPEQLEQAKLVAEACTWEEISSILRSDDRRNFQIDIETDSTAFDDEEVEKKQRIEYVRSMTEMMQLWIPAIQANPSMAPFAKELAMFSAGAFKIGRTLEEALGDAFDQIKNMPPQPNPEAEKLKGEMQMAQQKHQMEMQKGQADIQGKQQVAQLTAAGKQGDLQAKQQSAQMDMAQAQAEMQMEQQKAQLQMQIELAKLELEKEKMAMEREKMHMDMQAAQVQAQIDREQMDVEVEMSREKSAIDRQSMLDQSEIKRETMEFDAEHKRKMAETKQAQAKKATPK